MGSGLSLCTKNNKDILPDERCANEPISGSEQKLYYIFTLTPNINTQLALPGTAAVD